MDLTRQRLGCRPLPAAVSNLTTSVCPGWCGCINQSINQYGCITYIHAHFAIYSIQYLFLFHAYVHTWQLSL